MYATTRRYEGVTDPAEAAKRVKEGFVPLIKNIPGFVDYYFIDAGGGVMFSTGIFEDKAAADQSNKAAADWVRDNIASLIPNPPQTTQGSVVSH
jgi:hypothetical protein